MIIEIKNPNPELEKDILTFIPVNYRYQKNLSYYIESQLMTIDPFTDFVNIIVKHHNVTIKLHYYNKTECFDTICHKGGL
jgi:hypothetical protein